MGERQLDLFAGTGDPPESPARAGVEQQPALVPADLDDNALIAAIPRAGLANAADLAAEAGRRRLAAAVVALEQLCRRFAGFGLERKVPEQVAALQALALIGSPAAQTVARLIAGHIVQGPTRNVAVGIAAQLRSPLSAETVQALLQDADPSVRADACRCTGARPAAIPLLLELADDSDAKVRVAALCALGQLGWRGARPALARLLRQAPSVDIIDAVASIADEDCIIVLGRIVRIRPALADAARDALAMIDHPRARQVLAALQPPGAAAAR